jgi:dihydroorotate dehydrogenase
MKSISLARYDWQRTYEWNYDHAPEPIPHDEPVVPGHWNYCGLTVGSPLGIAAGPLLNGRWIRYYAALGFDVLTYKTVRSRSRACYPLPNLQPVETDHLSEGGRLLHATPHMHGSWAVSFGMPSKAPDMWRADIEATRRALPGNKVLSVSVVATPEADWSLEDVASDFVRCAKWAIESGADCIESNFSCPNVSSADAQLYQNPPAAGFVALKLRRAIGSRPLLIKIGHVTDESHASALAQAVASHANALVMVNCIPAKVSGASGLLFGGENRGIAGAAICNAVLEQLRLFAEINRRNDLKLQLVGVGGIRSLENVGAFLESGSSNVQLATAAMLDPGIGLAIRREMSERRDNCG